MTSDNNRPERPDFLKNKVTHQEKTNAEIIAARLRLSSQWKKGGNTYASWN